MLQLIANMNFRLINLLLLFSTAIWSQETMTINGLGTFPATPAWSFICDDYVLNDHVSIQIAKTEKGGYLKIEVETNNNSFAIAGNLYIDLQDFSAIRCTDKGKRTVLDNQLVSYYFLNAAEMNRLQKLDITSVRFCIKGKSNKFSSQTGYFTAVNKKKFFHTTYDFKSKTHETAKEIVKLYVQ